MFIQPNPLLFAKPLIAGFVLLFLISVEAFSQDYYVSPAGSDVSNTGTSVSSPFRTIQKAADVAGPGATVYIRQGTYRETVVPTNDGVTFTSYNGETATISGLDVVNATWSIYSANIYQAPYTLLLEDKNQLFVNGTKGNLARWPNDTDNDPFTLQAENIDAGSVSSITDASLPLGDYVGANLYCLSHWKWTAWGTRITGSNGNTINFTIPGDSWVSEFHNPGNRASGDNSKFYISGKLSLLDYDREWFYENGTLYLKAPGGGNPASQVIEAKARELAFDLTGRSGVRLENLNVKGAGILITGDNNVLDNLTATYLNEHNGVNMSWDFPVPVYGIDILGNNNVVSNSNISYAAGNLILLRGSANKIDNNYIHHANYINNYSAGIQLKGGNQTITRNTMYNSGRALINISRQTAGSIVRWNDLSYPMLNTDDGSFIYSGGGDVNLRGTEIGFNYLHDLSGGIAHNLTSGVYIDDGTINVTYHHNVVVNVNGEAVTKGGRGPVGRLVTNTTSYNCVPLFVHYHNGGSATVQNTFHNQPASNFENAASGDFRLKSTSSAVNEGVISAPYTNGFSGTAPDLGAYEYGADPVYASWTAGVGSTLYDINYTLPPGDDNLISNPSFESNLTGWTTWTNVGGSVYAEPTGGYEGAKKLTHWNSTAYQASTNQVVTGLTNGTYTLKAWVKASAGHTLKTMGVKNYGGNERSVSLPSTSTWTQITLTNVNVTNGQCEVYFWSDANAGGQWINADLVEFVPAGGNLVSNPSFEVDNTFTQTPTGWSTAGTDSDADYAEGSSNSRTGNYRGTHWKGSAYRVYTYQTVTGLSNGSYTAKAWVRSGGGQSTAIFVAQNYGGNQRTVNIPATSTWTQVSIPNIQVTNGKCELAFYSVAGAGQWINFDDVQLVPSGAGARTIAQEGKITKITEGQEVAATTLLVYPNPVTAELRVVLPAGEGVAQVRIEDLQGRLLMDKKLTNRQSLDVSSLSPGTYLVRTWHGEQWHFQKMIKK